MKLGTRSIGLVVALGVSIPGAGISAGASGDISPFNDARLLLHFAEGLVYSPGESYLGQSGLPVCETVVTSAPLSDDIALVFIIAAFPRQQEPRLELATFGIDYDPDLLEIIDGEVDGFVAEQSAGWPAPGTSIHLTWSAPERSRSVEIGWFAIRQLTAAPSMLELDAGAYGGLFGDFISTDEIDGFGTMGFGQEGISDCPPHGICCLPTGRCDLLTDYFCGRARGAFTGVDQSCASCERTGACCDEWQCVMSLEEDCVAGGRIYAGDGTVCEPNACIPTGACCNPDGTCSIVQQHQCNSMSFLPGASCEPSPCVELGACCYLYDAICVLANEESCLANGSTYGGDGSVCSPEICLPGVCCFEADLFACMYSTPEDCAKAGGHFIEGAYGPPGECDVCCCGPTIDSSWGIVKNRFRSKSG